MRSWLVITAVAAVTVELAAPRAEVQAQGARRVDSSFADVAIAAGRFRDAEFELFEQSRLAPRAPTVRGALGAFLASRGKLLVGAVLLEEAMHFGGDSTSIESRLFEIYRWSGRYARAAAQTHAPVSQELRTSMQRAPVAEVSGLTSAVVPFLPDEAFGMGRIPLTIGGDRVEADVQALSNGIQLPSTLALYGMIEAVGARGDTTYGVARSISIGGVTIGPVPVTLVPSLRVGRIGLDVLSLLHPTFDPTARTLTVRSAAPIEDARMMQSHPLFLTFPGVSFVPRNGEPPVALHAVAGRSALRGLRWTLDVDRGAIIIEP